LTPQPQYIYRAFRSKTWADSSGTVNINAFRRRPPRPDGSSPDSGGISVAFTEAGAKASLKTCHGLCRIEVSKLLALQLGGAKLGLNQDSGDHADITGLPFDTPDNADQAIAWAAKLASIAEVL
jgi:hypothetical protein